MSCSTPAMSSARQVVAPVQAGEFLADRDDVAELVVGLKNGQPCSWKTLPTFAPGPTNPSST